MFSLKFILNYLITCLVILITILTDNDDHNLFGL